MALIDRHTRQVYFRLLRYLKPHWKIFAVGVFGMVVLAVSEAGIPALLKPVLDGTFVDKDPAFLAWAPLSLVALFLVRGIAQVISSVAFAAISTRLMHTLREEMFDKLLRLPAAYYESHITGTVVSKFTYNVSQVSNAGVEVLNTLIKDTLIVIGLLAYVFWLDWQLSLFTFILLPTVALVAKILSKRQRKLSRGLQESFGNMTHIVDESIRGHKVIKIFGSQDYESQRFDRYAKEVRHRQFKLSVSSKIGVPIVELIGAFIMAAIIYIGASRAVEDQLTVGGFVAFFTALGLMFSPIKRLTKLTYPLQKGLAAAETVFELIDEQPEGTQATQRLEGARGEIVFEQVRFRYTGAEQDSLGPIDLAIEPGRVVAFVGPSGGGKTTLVSLVPRLYEVSGGRILVDGIDVRDLSLEDLREQVALVSQDVVLFNDTVAANIAYGKPTPMERIRAAASQANALGFIEAMPQGFDTQVGENGVKLSGGQRQRMAIARALLKDAPILIFDEATSALDTESERQVQDAIRRLEAGRTTLVIAHRLSTIQDADEIVVLDGGRIVERGTHNELLRLGGLYRHLHDTQFNVGEAADG
jgi:ATP-binding cassette, subfamily B, bacterial MsbA